MVIIYDVEYINNMKDYIRSENIFCCMIISESISNLNFALKNQGGIY